MKNKKISVKTVIILILIGIIIALIMMNLNNKNNNIEQQLIQKEQLGETTTDNAYISMETHFSQLNTKQQEINKIQNTAGQATVTADKILKDYTAYKNGQLITGTMANYVGQTVEATKITENGQNTFITIPKAGYYDTNSRISILTNNIATSNATQICHQIFDKNTTKTIEIPEDYTMCIVSVTAWNNAPNIGITMNIPSDVQTIFDSNNSPIYNYGNSYVMSRTVMIKNVAGKTITARPEYGGVVTAYVLK